MNVCGQPGYMVAELVIQRARPAGFEPATGCLEGTAGGWPDVAWRRSTRHLAAVIVAKCRRTLLGICLHWPTHWLTKT
jgi:hypothetical protein